MTDIIPEYTADHHTQSISLKFNIDPSANTMDAIMEVLRYGNVCFEDKATTILATIGQHDNCATSHIHINMIGNSRVEADLKNNASRHRRLYWNSYVGHTPPKQLSCKLGDCNDIDAVVKCLSYPYKEGNIIEMPSIFSKVYTPLSDATTAFLKTNGEALYKQALHQRLYKERQNQRQGNLLETIMEISKSLTEDSWLDWRNKVYDTYFNEIELKEIPDLGLFEKAVQKVAIFRKVVKPYHFCRA